GSQCRIGMNGAGFDGPEQRIVCALSLRVHRNPAAGKHAFGEGFAGFARALVAVSNDRDESGVGTASGGEEVLARELHAVPGSEELHQLIAVRSEIARWHIPSGPGCGSELSEQGGVGQGRADAVTGEYDYQLQVGIAACRRAGSGLRRGHRRKWARSQGEEENSNGRAHVIVKNSQREV